MDKEKKKTHFFPFPITCPLQISKRGLNNTSAMETKILFIQVSRIVYSQVNASKELDNKKSKDTLKDFKFILRNAK